MPSQIDYMGGHNFLLFNKSENQKHKGQSTSNIAACIPAYIPHFPFFLSTNAFWDIPNGCPFWKVSIFSCLSSL